MTDKPTGLALLRKPFAENQISKLPKPTKAQTESVKADFKTGIRCKVCGAWHHPDVVHLDYVGHAALTDRLLDADINWSWEPVAFTDLGLPAFDQTGGLWIRLTVDNVTRLGYGHAASKPNQDPGAREKEVIGDALRNAAMRFGAALDLWHKGDLHVDDTESAPTKPLFANIDDGQRDELIAMIEGYGFNIQKICEYYRINALTEIPAEEFENVKSYLNKAFDKKRAAEIAAQEAAK
jgi:hypothetical protein